MVPSPDVSPVGLLLRAGPRAEVPLQVGWALCVASKAAAAPAGARLSPACHPLGRSQKVLLEGISLEAMAQASVNTEQQFLKGHGTLVGLECCLHMWPYTRSQRWPLGALLT